VRDMSHLLHPPELEELGLPVAIDSYIHALRRRLDIYLEFAPQPTTIRLPAKVELALYRTVQEALTNVARHANARMCVVSLKRLPESVVLTVSDDGVGFVQEESVQRHDMGIGLLGIRERARELGGTLQVDSRPGQGTVLTVEIPLPAAESSFESAPQSRLATSAGPGQLITSGGS